MTKQPPLGVRELPVRGCQDETMEIREVNAETGEWIREMFGVYIKYSEK